MHLDWSYETKMHKHFWLTVVNKANKEPLFLIASILTWWGRVMGRGGVGVLEWGAIWSENDSSKSHKVDLSFYFLGDGLYWITCWTWLRSFNSYFPKFLLQDIGLVIIGYLYIVEKQVKNLHRLQVLQSQKLYNYN